MVSHYINFSLAAQDTALKMWELVEAELLKYGNPISWAAVDADPQQQTITIAALIKGSSNDTKQNLPDTTHIE